jgi:hypothetical protein
MDFLVRQTGVFRSENGVQNQHLASSSKKPEEARAGPETPSTRLKAPGVSIIALIGRKCFLRTQTCFVECRQSFDLAGWCCPVCTWGITAPRLDSTIAALAFNRVAQEDFERHSCESQSPREA